MGQYESYNNSLYGYFGCPYFEDVNKTILVIPLKNNGNNLPGFSDFEVVIKKNFVDSENISMARDYQRRFVTGGVFDSESPALSDDFEIYCAALSKKLVNDYDNIDVNDSEQVKNLIRASPRSFLWVYGTFTDSLSGLYSMTITYEPVKSDLYQNTKTIYLNTVKFDGAVKTFTSVKNSSSAGYEVRLFFELDGWDSYEPGIYDLIFTVKDNAENVTQKKYRVLCGS